MSDATSTPAGPDFPGHLSGGQAHSQHVATMQMELLTRLLDDVKVLQSKNAYLEQSVHELRADRDQLREQVSQLTEAVKSVQYSTLAYEVGLGPCGGTDGDFGGPGETYIDPLVPPTCTVTAHESTDEHVTSQPSSATGDFGGDSAMTHTGGGRTRASSSGLIPARSDVTRQHATPPPAFFTSAQQVLPVHATPASFWPSNDFADDSCHAASDLKDVNQVVPPQEITENWLVNLTVHILLQHGSLPVGKMGSLLHKAANNHSLPTILKERYGGLKKFLLRHKEDFCVGIDHPYNPHVYLRSAPPPVENPVSTPPCSRRARRRAAATRAAEKRQPQ